MMMAKTQSPWKRRTNRRRQKQPPGTGHPARTPDIRPLEIYTARTLQKKLQGPDIRRPARTSGVQPGHPVPHEPPDIRPDARTSGASCLRAATLGHDPCIPSPPDYIYSLLPYVLGLALI